MSLIRVPEGAFMNKGMRIGWVVGLVLGGALFGMLVREITSHDEVGVAAALGIPAIIALFGVFWLAEHWKDALTAAFGVTYFIFLAAALTGLLFPEGQKELPAGIQQALDGFTELMKIVMAAYFGQEAVRAVAQAYSNAAVYGGNKAGPSGNPPDEPSKKTPSAAPRSGQPGEPPLIDTNSLPMG